MKLKVKKTKFILAGLVILFILATLAAMYVVKVNMCRDIIGDGYYMGTDPEPVVIGNSCDR